MHRVMSFLLPALFLQLCTLISFVSAYVVVRFPRHKFLYSSSSSSHGFIKEVTVAGQVYPGWDPNTDPYTGTATERVIRKIPNDGPVTDTSSADLSCNQLGEAGQPISATVAAGGQVTWQWNQWLSDHLGPVWTFMASCEGPCSQFNLDLDKGGKSLKWFKIDAQGYDASTKRWASEDLIAAGNKWTSTVPSNLKAGEYLMRHEVYAPLPSFATRRHNLTSYYYSVALHSSPPQFYPSCLQLKVTGGGSAVPSGDQVASIPGLFQQSQFPNVWADKVAFQIPGPAVFGSGGSGNTGNTGAGNTGADPAASSSTAAPAGGAATTQATNTNGAAATTTASSAAAGATTTKAGHCRATTARQGSKRHALVRHRRASH
jgi:hypothetical protein